MSNKRLAILFIILAALSVGGTTTFGKFALYSIPSLPFTFFRFFIGSMLLTLLLLREKNSFKLPSRSVILVCLIQVVNTTVYPFGLRLTTATISQTLFSTIPILTAILAFLFFKETLSRKKLLGVIMGFLGTLFIILLPVFGQHAAFQGDIRGNLLVFVSVTCLAVYSIISKGFFKEYSPLYMTTLFAWLTTIATFLLSLPEFLSHGQFIFHVSILTWGAMLYVGIFGTLFFLFYQYAVKYGSAVIASTINYISPIVTFTFAFFVIGERLTVEFVIGALFALSGVFLVTSPKFKISFLLNFLRP